jgi:DNA-binding MarR family transcriptional regulator
MKSSESTNPHARSILDSLRRIVQGLRVSSVSTQAQSGISGARAFVLQRLGEGPVQSLNELAERTHTHQSSVSVVVEKLVREGLVARTPSARDARRVEIALTAEGKRLLDRIPETMQEKLLTAITKMNPADRASLARLMDKLTFLAGLPPEPPMLFFENKKNQPRKITGKNKRKD